nr:MAG TPA: hypothetical protein [Caudoviricetes sp.]
MQQTYTHILSMDILYYQYFILPTFCFMRLFSLFTVLIDTFMRSAHSSSGTSTHRISNSVRSSSVKLHSASRYLISGIVNSQIFNFYPPLLGIRKIFNHAILGFFQIFHVIPGQLSINHSYHSLTKKRLSIFDSFYGFIIIISFLFQLFNTLSQLYCWIYSFPHNSNCTAHNRDTATNRKKCVQKLHNNYSPFVLLFLPVIQWYFPPGIPRIIVNTVNHADNMALQCKDVNTVRVLFGKFRYRAVTITDFTMISLVCKQFTPYTVGRWHILQPVCICDQFRKALVPVHAKCLAQCSDNTVTYRGSVRVRIIIRIHHITPIPSLSE